ncbi:MAG: hypothetical protein ACLP4V_13300 [Methylocella sp.]
MHGPLDPPAKQEGHRAQQIATLTGGDLVKIVRKGTVTYKIEF